MKLSTFNQSEEIESKQQQDKGGLYENKFDFEHGFCNYRNQIKFQPVLNPQSSSTIKLQISNKVCKSNQDQLQKITVIRLNNREIILRDQYKFSSVLPYENSAHIERKSQLFKKSMREFCGMEHKGQKVTKNLAKNFIKAFFSYIAPLRINISQEVNSKIDELQQKKYNNSVIREILKDHELHSFFKDFVNNKAVEWITNSKIKDKQLHLGAVKMFESMIEKTEPQKCKIKIEESSQQFSQMFKAEVAQNRYRFLHDNRRLSDDEDENSLMANCGDSVRDIQ